MFKLGFGVSLQTWLSGAGVLDLGDVLAFVAGFVAGFVVSLVVDQVVS